MNRRIYILYTGGTIGMQRSADGYVPMAGLADLINEKIPLHLSASVPEYHLEELDTLIDSTNATPADWRRIAAKVVDNYANYDGFIILHGTDTLAYTASALSFMLQGLQKPVIITGSQIPLSELRNDALDNLITALVLARNYPVAEVCLYFSGRLLRGNRATKLKATGFDAFDSPNYPWLGKVGINIEMEQANIRPPSTAGEQFELPHYDKRVVPLRLYPGIDADYLRHVLQLPMDGLILESFGVGNAPDRDPELLRLLDQANSRGLVTVNLSQCLYGRVDLSSYATGSALARTGVIGGADMTMEATFAKLHHLLMTESSAARVRDLMATDICGELTPA
ncbi:asparaginase [Motiliproteus sediminis]|uniref:asparaginase n=1 Tax=Motiliproteus sediminis TaxID=1468178 RepID=UPI001AEF3BE6|nr:asparaginase [Motiliproteus sediminis]